MFNHMATKKGELVKTIVPQTDYQLHKTQQPAFSGNLHRILDYTEFRLVRYAESIKDKQQHLVLMAMVIDYRLGNIAVAWKSGRPVWIKVIKDS